MTLLCTARREQVSEVAMVAEHEDHNKKQSNAMWHIKLQDTPCVLSRRAPRLALSRPTRGVPPPLRISLMRTSRRRRRRPQRRYFMESLTTDEAEAWVRILTEQKNRVQNETTENDSLATTYFKLALVMYVLALGALVYLKYFGSFSFGEEKVDPKAKRGGRGGKPKKGK